MDKGNLFVVGVGICAGKQCTAEARDAIEAADIVYTVVGHFLAQRWIETLNSNTVSLSNLYGSGRTRAETYEAMAGAIVESVRAGNSVCAAFYGHPGVFVGPSHEAIRRTRAEGFEAHMLPGVSAEACLYADLGIDPGQHGCQSYEATDFLLSERRIDGRTALIIWQIAVAGDLNLMAFEPDPRRLALLSEILQETYPAEHEIVVYEAATLPVTRAKVQRLSLGALHTAEVTQASTLYVPPLSPPRASPERLALIKSRLGAGA